MKPVKYRLHFREALSLSGAEEFKKNLENFGIKLLKPVKESDKTADIEAKATVVLGMRSHLRITFRIETLLP